MALQVSPVKMSAAGPGSGLVAPRPTATQLSASTHDTPKGVKSADPDVVGKVVDVHDPSPRLTAREPVVAPAESRVTPVHDATAAHDIAT
jgi:hypothetical protein